MFPISVISSQFLSRVCLVTDTYERGTSCAQLQLFLTSLALLTGPLAAINARAAPPEVMSQLVMREGEKVWLFHSGTPDVKKAICLRDVIPVYR